MPDPITPGWNRAPSSLVKLAISIARRVLTPAASSARITATPASTPRTPSNLPPGICVSRWLPIISGGSDGSVPSRRANMLPIPSTVTTSPASSAQ
ncbi:hypothetical protein D3C87_1661360 [compost metagenome]